MKLKHLFLKIFGEELSDEETLRKAECLVEVYRNAYGMPSLEEFFDNKKESEKTE